MVQFLLILQIMLFAGALITLFFPREKTNLAGAWALCVAIAQFVLTAMALPMSETLNWPVAFGVTLSFAFDPLAAIALLVISGATAIAILYSLFMPQKVERTPSFYCLILLVLFGTTNVALSHDLLQFYVFWEAMLIPAWALVINWNEVPERARYTGLKFFIITHIGAVFMLASILWLYVITGTTNMDALASMLPAIPSYMLLLIAAMFLLGFIVKLAIFPFHTWLPDAYTSSVMPVTLMLVGVMTNIGVYGMARFFPFLQPGGSSLLSTPLLVAAVVTMFYGGFMAFVEKNAKRVVAYSSISQMGYVLFGLATLIPSGMAGSLFNIFNQAVTKLALFMCLGIVAHHAGTWNMDELGGWAKRLPLAAIVAVAAVLSLVGAPPMLGFWPEFLTFTAGFVYGNYTLAVLALIAAALTGAYGLRLIKMVFFGPLQKQHEGETVSIGTAGSFVLVSSFVVLLVLGVFPGIAFNLVRLAVESLGFALVR